MHFVLRFQANFSFWSFEVQQCSFFSWFSHGYQSTWAAASWFAFSVATTLLVLTDGGYDWNLCVLPLKRPLRESTVSNAKPTAADFKPSVGPRASVQNRIQNLLRSLLVWRFCVESLKLPILEVIQSAFEITFINSICESLLLTLNPIESDFIVQVIDLHPKQISRFIHLQVACKSPNWSECSPWLHLKSTKSGISLAI